MGKTRCWGFGARTRPCMRSAGVVRAAGHQLCSPSTLQLARLQGASNADQCRNLQPSRNCFCGITLIAAVCSLTADCRVSSRSGRAFLVKCSHNDSAKPYFRFPSIVAHAWATAELALSPPGVVAQPPFSTKLPCIYADTFLSSTKLLAASDEC